MTNPLLHPLPLPDFAAVEAAHVAPAMATVLNEVRTAMASLEERAALAESWEQLAAPLEALVDRLQTTWGVVNHLLGVRNTDALRTAHAALQPEVVQVSMGIAQSLPLYDACVRLRKEATDPVEQRLLDCHIRDAAHAGVALTGEKKERFNAIAMRLAELSTQFSNHVLDATKAWSLTLREQAEVDGLPTSLRAMTAQAARGAGEEDASAEAGPWRLTLDFPCFGPFLKHSKRRDLREKLYRAFISRASEGQGDNAPLIAEILQLRREKAQILGFETFAELSLGSKMAANVADVRGLLEQLRGKSIDAATEDLAELNALAASEGAPTPLRHWDIAYWSERLREQRFSIEEEALRPWLPFPTVLNGLFALAGELFDVRFVDATAEVSRWHDDVRYYRVLNASNDAEIAGFYLDPYSRPSEKRGGAWMDECVGRSARLGSGGRVRLPVAYLVCNGTPPVDGAPSLMRFREVETLFHEFGHGLQHMLSTVDDGLASGIRNVEWDAVELPSQFMENWCYHGATMRKFSGHVDSGEPMPDELFASLVAARSFRAGSAMLRQLNFALTDLALHHEHDPSGAETAFDVQATISETTSILAPLPEDRFLCAFGHIFAGGYAAGYYSYKWAEVLSADAFSAFEDAGLDDPAAVRAVGQRFRDTVLSLGGSVHPMDVFSSFRGRNPTTDALLRHNGLA
ncbi:MAG: M3 family metallopeptidase [Myxococcales bacterium]|nr:M3 family metallopeptidase [Myxococcales bacterium]